jgi:hypothetical protein
VLRLSDHITVTSTSGTCRRQGSVRRAAASFPKARLR